MIIATSGYYSTGSSAAFVLLKEYAVCSEGVLANWETQSHSYEHILLYSPNALFDLEDKLLHGNSILRSDEALKSFYENMFRLYNNKYMWCDDYKRILGDKFLQSVNEFLDKLIDFQVDGHWEYHYGDDKFNLKKFLGSIRRTIMREPIIGSFYKWSSYRIPKGVNYAFPSPEKYFKAAHDFIYQYEEMMRGDTNQIPNLLLNHFVLPHNLYRLPRYFDENEIRVVVVDRDPRDVYIMEKYRDRKIPSLLPCNNVEEFVRFWKVLRDREKKSEDPRIVRVQFEDMIYRYEETVAYIETACGLSADSHTQIKKFFSPEKSMYNTQLFKQDSKWEREIEYIEKELSEYLYDFPEGSGIKEKISSDQYGIYVC